MSDKKEEPKTYRIIISEWLGFSSNVTVSTIQSTLAATGSLALYDQYYNEAKASLQRASTAGTISPFDIASICATLDKWRGLSEGYSAQIKELSDKNEDLKLKGLKTEIDKQADEERKMVVELHEKLVGGQALNQFKNLFDLPARDSKDTTCFKGKKHADLVEMVVKWIELKDKQKLNAQIIHGQREAGVDIVVQVSGGVTPKFGIQLKNDNDVKEEKFSVKLKAQITDAKKHQLQGIIIILAADITDKTTESRINGILSEISQMKDTTLIAISPQQMLSLIGEL